MKCSVILHAFTVCFVFYSLLVIVSYSKGIVNLFFGLFSPLFELEKLYERPRRCQTSTTLTLLDTTRVGPGIRDTSWTALTKAAVLHSKTPPLVKVILHFCCISSPFDHSSCFRSSTGSPKKCLYIQMELCDTKTLRHWIDERNKKKSSQNSKRRLESLNIVQQMVSGIEYIHSKNLIHRDLKVSQTKQITS